MNDGEEMTLWFASEGDCVFAIWGYTNDGISQTTIEIEAESSALVVSKNRIDELCHKSIEMANLIRTIFENHALCSIKFYTIYQAQYQYIVSL